MKFSLDKSLEILESTPNVISSMLQNLSKDWTNNNEGENTWTAKEVVAHLIVCEETNWLPRIKIILKSPETVFSPIDMQAHFEIAKKSSLTDLLFQFSGHRKKGIGELQKMNLQESDFLKTGTHQIAGKIMLKEIIATWATHDLAHIAQIARIMAKQNKELVGNFKQFLKILN
jgi:hypothetical protein